MFGNFQVSSREKNFQSVILMRLIKQKFHGLKMRPTEFAARFRFTKFKQFKLCVNTFIYLCGCKLCLFSFFGTVRESIDKHSTRLLLSSSVRFKNLQLQYYFHSFNNNDIIDFQAFSNFSLHISEAYKLEFRFETWLISRNNNLGIKFL